MSKKLKDKLASIEANLEQLRDQRTSVMEVLEQVDDVGELQSADFPEGYVEAFAMILRAANEECPEAPSTSTTIG